MEKPFCTFVIQKVSFILILKNLSVHRIYTGPFCTFTIYEIYRTFLYIYDLQNIQNLSVHRIYTETFLYIYDLQNIQNLSVHRQDIYRNLSVHLRSTKYIEHRIYTETFLYIYDLQNIQDLSVHSWEKKCQFKVFALLI